MIQNKQSGYLQYTGRFTLDPTQQQKIGISLHNQSSLMAVIIFYALTTQNLL